MIIAIVMLLPVSVADNPTDEAVRSDPTNPRNATWQEKGVLAIGGGGLHKWDVEYLERAGFGAIASFRAEFDDPADFIRAEGMNFLAIPVDHAVNMNLTQIRNFVDWMEEQVDAGRPVYAHCTNGMHRAAAFATAWEMKRTGISFDEASERVKARRWGTMMRAPAPLLAYEAFLRNEPGLTVVLISSLARPEPGETMPIVVEVLGPHGPVAHANVTVWGEESGFRARGVTNATGRASFMYKAPATQGMDHLHARASAPGFIDGADSVELFFRERVPARATLEVNAELLDDGVSVKVTRKGQSVRAHVLVEIDGGVHASDVTGTGETRLRFDVKPSFAIVRAESWGVDGTRLELRAPGPVLPTPPVSSPTDEASEPPSTTVEEGTDETPAFTRWLHTMKGPAIILGTAAALYALWSTRMGA